MSSRRGPSPTVWTNQRVEDATDNVVARRAAAAAHAVARRPRQAGDNTSCRARSSSASSSTSRWRRRVEPGGGAADARGAAAVLAAEGRLGQQRRARRGGRGARAALTEAAPEILEPTFFMALTWSVGGTCDAAGRLKFDELVRSRVKGCEGAAGGDGRLIRLRVRRREEALGAVDEDGQPPPARPPLPAARSARSPRPLPRSHADGAAPPHTRPRMLTSPHPHPRLPPHPARSRTTRSRQDRLPGRLQLDHRPHRRLGVLRLPSRHARRGEHARRRRRADGHGQVGDDRAEARDRPRRQVRADHARVLGAGVRESDAGHPRREVREAAAGHRQGHRAAVHDVGADARQALRRLHRRLQHAEARALLRAAAGRADAHDDRPRRLVRRKTLK